MRARASAASGRLWVLLPIRGEALGKSRLGSVLDRGARMRLNRALLRRTLAVVEAWQGSTARCLVVTACARSGWTARRAGAIWLREARPRRGLNRAVATAHAYALDHGAWAVLVLSGDLPQLTPDALDAFVTAASGAKVGIAPDRARSGTNALLLATRARFAFAYGPESFERHVATARMRFGAPAVRFDPPLACDLDTPADWEALRAGCADSRWYSPAKSIGRRRR